MESGSQVVSRAAAILRAVNAAGPTGARLLDVADHVGVSRPTVHRLLQSLADEGFVRQVEGRRYALGPSLYELGLSAPNPLGDVERFRPFVVEMAQRFGDVVYLAVRRGDRVHYAMREEGTYPIVARTVQVGSSAPLTRTYGGLSLLAAMSPTEAKDVVERIELDPPRAAERLTVVQRLAGQWADRGFTEGHDLVLLDVEGIGGVSAPVPTASGHPYLSVSYSAISSRLQPARAAVIGHELLVLARRISELI